MYIYMYIYIYIYILYDQVQKVHEDPVHSQIKILNFSSDFDSLT